MQNFTFFLVALAILCSCKKEGCTNPKAVNYDSEATKEDGSCKINYGGTYFMKDSSFYDGEFYQYNTYDMTVKFLSDEDSLSLNNIGIFNKEIIAVLSGTGFVIPQQTYDPNADINGSGEFDFGTIEYSVNYGVVEHHCVGTKN